MVIHSKCAVCSARLSKLTWFSCVNQQARFQQLSKCQTLLICLLFVWWLGMYTGPEKCSPMSVECQTAISVLEVHSRTSCCGCYMEYTSGMFSALQVIKTWTCRNVTWYHDNVKFGSWLQSLPSHELDQIHRKSPLTILNLLFLLALVFAFGFPSTASQRGGASSNTLCDRKQVDDL